MPKVTKNLTCKVASPKGQQTSNLHYFV